MTISFILTTVVNIKSELTGVVKLAKLENADEIKQKIQTAIEEADRRKDAVHDILAAVIGHIGVLYASDMLGVDQAWVSRVKNKKQYVTYEKLKEMLLFLSRFI